MLSIGEIYGLSFTRAIDAKELTRIFPSNLDQYGDIHRITWTNFSPLSAVATGFAFLPAIIPSAMYEAAVMKLDTHLLEPSDLDGKPFEVLNVTKDATLAFREQFRTYMALITIGSTHTLASPHLKTVPCNPSCKTFRFDLQHHYRTMAGNVLAQPAMTVLPNATSICLCCHEHFTIFEQFVAKKIWESLPIWPGRDSWEDFLGTFDNDGESRFLFLSKSFAYCSTDPSNLLSSRCSVDRPRS